MYFFSSCEKGFNMIVKENLIQYKLLVLDLEIDY